MVLGASALRGFTGLWSLMFYPRIPPKFNRCRWHTIGYLIRIIIRSPNGAGFYIHFMPDYPELFFCPRGDRRARHHHRQTRSGASQPPELGQVLHTALKDL